MEIETAAKLTAADLGYSQLKQGFVISTLLVCSAILHI